MPFKPGESGNPAGRPTGSANELTKTVKQTVLEVFHKLQNDPNSSLEAFAVKHPRDFYAIAAKLIPTEFTGTLRTEIVWNEVKTYYDPHIKADASN